MSDIFFHTCLLFFNLGFTPSFESAVCGNNCCVNFKLVRNKCIECPDGKFGRNCSFNCKEGFFGKKCEKICSCTEKQYCSSVYGCVPQSAQGCSPGRRGEGCHLNCEPNTYGKNCTETCKCNEDQYCHPEKGCRDVPIPDNARGPVTNTPSGNPFTSFTNFSSQQTSDSFTDLPVSDSPFQKIFEETWFKITVLSCIVCITLAVILAIVLQTRKKIMKKKSRHSISQELDSRERGATGRPSNSYSIDRRNDHRVQNGNNTNTHQNDVNPYASLRESSFIENSLNSCSSRQRKGSIPKSKSSKKSKSVKSNDAKKKEECESRNFMSDDNIDFNDSCDIELKANGYHKLDRNFSIRSAMKPPNYDETQPPSQRKQNQYSYNMLELKEEQSCDMSSDPALQGYHQTCIRSLQKDDFVQEHISCDTDVTTDTQCQSSRQYSLVRGNTCPGDTMETEKKMTNKSYSLQRIAYPEREKTNSKPKFLSKGKKQYSLDRCIPEDHYNENTYTKTDFRRKKSAPKQLSGNVTIISRLSSLLTSKPKSVPNFQEDNTGSSKHFQRADAPRMDPVYGFNTRSQDLPPPPPPDKESESFETDKEYTETERNKYGYSLVRGCRPGDVTVDSVAMYELQGTTHCFDHGKNDLTESSAFPYDDQTSPEKYQAGIHNAQMTNYRESEFLPLPPYPNFEENLQNVQPLHDSYKQENDFSNKESTTRTVIVHESQNYSLAIPEVMSDDVIGITHTENSSSKLNSEMRRKKSTAKGVNGQVTIISRLSSLFATNYKPGKNVHQSKTMPTTAIAETKDENQYFVLEKQT